MEGCETFGVEAIVGAGGSLSKAQSLSFLVIAQPNCPLLPDHTAARQPPTTRGRVTRAAKAQGILSPETSGQKEPFSLELAPAKIFCFLLFF